MSGAQPNAVGALLKGPPTVLFGLFIGIEIRNLIVFGASSVKDLLILCLIPAVMLLMATLVVRAVELSTAGIVVRYYLGRKVELTWPEVKAVELFTVESTQESKRTVRVKPHRGRNVAFNSNLSNFDSLLSVLEKSSLTGVIRHAPRPKGPLEL